MSVALETDTAEFKKKVTYGYCQPCAKFVFTK